MDRKHYSDGKCPQQYCDTCMFIYCLQNGKAGEGMVYRIERMVEKILIVYGVPLPEQEKKGVLVNLQHIPCVAVGDHHTHQGLSI